MVEVPELAEREAVRLLTGVGGSREWWTWNSVARVGHLRINVTVEEFEEVPPGTPAHDAGETGPERVRSNPRRR